MKEFGIKNRRIDDIRSGSAETELPTTTTGMAKPGGDKELDDLEARILKLKAPTKVSPVLPQYVFRAFSLSRSRALPWNLDASRFPPNGNCRDDELAQRLEKLTGSAPVAFTKTTLSPLDTKSPVPGRNHGDSRGLTSALAALLEDTDLLGEDFNDIIAAAKESSKGRKQSPSKSPTRSPTRMTKAELDDVDELLGSIKAEVELESKTRETDQDIERRLTERVDKLKELKVAPRPTHTAVGLGPPPKPFQFLGDGSDDEEDMPWCCICNDDAVVKCLGCDGDLYCRSCFREGHPRDDPEMARHRTEPFSNQKSTKKRI